MHYICEGRWLTLVMNRALTALFSDFSQILLRTCVWVQFRKLPGKFYQRWLLFLKKKKRLIVYWKLGNFRTGWRLWHHTKNPENAFDLSILINEGILSPYFNTYVCLFVYSHSFAPCFCLLTLNDLSACPCLMVHLIPSLMDWEAQTLHSSSNTANWNETQSTGARLHFVITFFFFSLEKKICTKKAKKTWQGWETFW